MMHSLPALLRKKIRSGAGSPPPADTVTIDQGEAAPLPYNGTLQLTATLTSGAVPQWSTADPAIATVSAAGLATWKGAGEVAITVTDPTNGLTDTIILSAAGAADGPPVASFTVTGEGYTRIFTDTSTGNPSRVVIDIDGDRRVLGQAPLAQFVTKVVGRTVTVTDSSKHYPTSVVVDWGDGNQEAMEMGRSTTYTFPSNGAKSIKLTATSPYGSSEVTQVVDVLLLPPIANFSISMYGYKATLVDASTSLPDTRVVDWGDGSPAEAVEPGATLTHTYPTTPGSVEYTVTLTATNAEGVDTHQEIVTAQEAVSGTFLSLTPLLNDSAVSAGATFQVDSLTQSVSFQVFVNDVPGRVDEIKINNLHNARWVYDQANCLPLDTLSVYKYIALRPGDVVRFAMQPFPEPGLAGTPGPVQEAIVTLNAPLPGTVYAYGVCEEPRIVVNTAMPDMTGARTIRVGGVGDIANGYQYEDPNAAFLKAVEWARDTPVIVKLKNGVKWVGIHRMYSDPLQLHWIVVEPEDTSHLPGEGIRFDNTLHDPLGTATPWLLTNGGGSSAALRVNGGGVTKWRWIGVGMGLTADNSQGLTGIVRLDLHPTNDVGQFPSHICLDRCWIEGKNIAAIGGYVAKGVYAAGAHIAVINCRIAKIEYYGSDSQAVGGVTGPGPWLIENSYLEATGENIMLGGGNAALNIMPEDVTIRRNYLPKPVHWFSDAAKPIWDGQHRTIKNLFEIKHGRRILVEDNIFDRMRVDDQDAAINLKLGEGTTNSEMDASDVIFRYNKIINLERCNGIALSSRYGMQYQDNKSVFQARRWAIYQNLFQWNDVGGSVYRTFIEGPPGDMGELFLDHNAFLGVQHEYGAHMIAAPAQNLRWTGTNNVFDIMTQGGITAQGGLGYPNEAEGAASLGDATVTRDIRGNLFTQRPSGVYPAEIASGNGWPQTIGEIDFENYGTGNFRLKATSPYAVGGLNYTGTDGTNPGPDYDALDARLAGVM